MSFQILVENATEIIQGFGPFQGPDEFGDEYTVVEVEDDSLYDQILEHPNAKWRDGAAVYD